VLPETCCESKSRACLVSSPPLLCAIKCACCAPYVESHSIAGLRLGQVDSADVNNMLHELSRAGSAPGSVNRLRASLHSVFATAIEAKKWTGQNPVAGVKTRSVPKRAYSLLRAEEVAKVLEVAGGTWRDLCATAIYLGLRKGELFALRKQDVNLADREITVGRSHDSDTTKGKKAVVLPIPQPLQPFLEHALKSAPGTLVFPRENGTRRPESTGMEKVWRRVLVRADIVIGYRHTCRSCAAKKLPSQHEFPDGEQRRCPTCNTRMWPAGIPRPMRFHDVRHTTATLLLKAGVPIQHVQRVLRHANVRTTVDTYGHLANEDLRAPLELLPQLPKESLPKSDDSGHVPNMCQPLRSSKIEGPGPEDFSSETGPLNLERNTRFELATFALAKRPVGVGSPPRSSPTVPKRAKSFRSH
jgi:integrase